MISILCLPIVLEPNITSTAAQPAPPTAKTWGGGENDIGQSVAVDASHNTYVTGSTASFGPVSPTQSSLILLKYDPSGGLVWQRVWSGSGNGSDVGMSIGLDASGNIYVTGWTTSFGAGSYDVLLLKFNSTGFLLWQRVWGGVNIDVGNGVGVDASGYVYVTGSSSSFGVGGNCGGAACSDVFLLKFDPSGSLLWQKTWGGSKDDNAQGIAVDASGNAYVTGFTDSFDGVYADAFLLKFNSSGSLLWQTTWGGSSFDLAHAVSVDSSGHIYVAGETASIGAGAQDVFLMKFDSNGNLAWQKTWGGSGLDVGNGVVVDHDSGDVYVSGTTSSFGVGSYDVLLLKFDSTGSLLLQKSWGGSGFDQGYGIAVDSYGNAFLTGEVSEGPPYAFGSGNFTTRTATFSPTAPGGTVGSPTASAGIPTGNVGSPNGSQNYAGMQDIFLLKYPVTFTVGFNSDPATAGSVDFNGTIYANGENGNYSNGVATAAAIPSPGYAFSSWTITGKITVANGSSNPTIATISGNGTITAHFTPILSPVISKVNLTPLTASVYIGRSANFIASAVCYTNSCPSGISFAWALNSSLGTLNFTSGSFVTFEAGPLPGSVNLTVTAFLNGVGVSAFAIITFSSAPVVSVQLPPSAPSGVALRSNATISSFLYDSAGESFTFIGGGPHGSIGIVNITIPNSIIGSNTNITIYNNGVVITSARISSDTANRYVYFILTFSSDNVKIVLSIPISQAGPSLEILEIAAVAVVLLLAASLAFYRRVHRPTTAAEASQARERGPPWKNSPTSKS